MSLTENKAQTEIAALVAAETLARPMIVGNAVPAAVVPANYTFTSLERLVAAPTRLRGQFNVLTAEAFKSTVGLYRPEGAVSLEQIFGSLPIFFNRSGTSAKVEAILNFYEWRDHKVTLAQGLSQPFLDWYRLNSQPQPQRKFALFLEERAQHVVKPEGASLLELCRKFKATVTVRFQSVVENENGDNSLEYIQGSEAGTAGAKQRMKVPERITLFMPVWNGGEPVKFEARFGYSIDDGGKLALSFEILNLEELLTNELRKIVANIAKSLAGSVIIEGENAAVPAL